MKEQAEKKATPVPAVSRSGRILRLLAKSSLGLSLSEISRSLELPKGSLYSLLMALSELDLVKRDSQGRLWELGFGCLELGMAYYRKNPSFERFNTIAERIRAACQESVYYAVLRGTEVLYVHVAHEKSHALTVDHLPGDTVHAHCSALGKALLAGLSDGEISRLYAGYDFKRMTERTITSLDELIKDIQLVRDEGYGFNNEENEYGVSALAAPIRDRQGITVAALGVGVPASRMNLEKRMELAGLLIRGAKALSGEDGLPPPWHREP